MIKKHRFLFSVLYLILSILLFLLFVKRVSFLHFSYDLLFFFILFDLFILSHFIIEIKKLYSFIYSKRYIIGILVLLVLVIGKYNGSSIEIWNNIIESEYKTPNGIIIGKTRSIRSDEWLVSTPTTLTQASDEVKFSSNNSVLGAHDNLVTLYPNLPSHDISMLSTPNNIGFLFLDVERAFSLSWYLPYFILFFATFEMLMILTKKNKIYSLMGSIMITFSPVIQWWQSASIPAYGALAIVLFYYFITSKNWKKKLILSILFGYSGYLYIMCMYPAWQVPYAYIYLILLIWIIKENKEKIKKIDFIYLIPVLLVIVIPIVIIFKENYDVLTIVNSTVYPGARMSTGGGEWRTLFTYVLDVFYPYKELGNPCEFSQYLSLFPIPIVYSIYLMIKNKKKDLFLILSNIVLIFLTIWVMFPLPKIISRLSLMYMSTEIRAQVAIGYLSVILIVYILTNYEIKAKDKKLINKKNIIIAIISLLSIFITIKISNYIVEKTFPGYVNLSTSLITLCIFSLIAFLFLYNHKKTNIILVIILIIISIISGGIVSPINKGLNVFYDKPISKELKKIISEDKNSTFMSIDGSISTANYLAVNGAKTINTINHIPNLELYYKLDPELRYDHIYNRYEHIGVRLTEESTYFELVQHDYINIYITKEDACKIGVDYFVANTYDTEKYSELEEVYGKYNVHIYKNTCN